MFAAPRGGLLRLQNFRHTVFDRAAQAAGLHDLTPHSLRHTAASLAIASGADVKVVQLMLGHASATMPSIRTGTFTAIGSTRCPIGWTLCGPRADFLRTLCGLTRS